jgi:hypothetical protein
MCQVYAVGYQQRHPEWLLSPWVECHGLMEATFGQREPTLWQMTRANPQAVLEHFGWNISLVTNGIQVSLFNAMSGTANPDYAPVNKTWLVLVPSAGALLAVVWGAILAVRRWDYWWPHWFRERRGAWLIMLATVCTIGPVILTQRPRPSYLFSTSLVLMAVVGSAVYLLVHCWPVLTKRVAAAAALIILAAVPSYYTGMAPTRPLYANYERLKPFIPMLRENDNNLLLGDYAGELFGYLNLANRNISVFDYSLLASRKPEQSLDLFLRNKGINILYVQPRVMNEMRSSPNGNQLLDQPEMIGWRKIGSPAESDDRPWLLLYREKDK